MLVLPPETQSAVAHTFPYVRSISEGPRRAATVQEERLRLSPVPLISSNTASSPRRAELGRATGTGPSAQERPSSRLKPRWPARCLVLSPAGYRGPGRSARPRPLTHPLVEDRLHVYCQRPAASASRDDPSQSHLALLDGGCGPSAQGPAGLERPEEGSATAGGGAPYRRGGRRERPRAGPPAAGARARKVTRPRRSRPAVSASPGTARVPRSLPASPPLASAQRCRFPAGSHPPTAPSSLQLGRGAAAPALSPPGTHGEKPVQVQLERPGSCRPRSAPPLTAPLQGSSGTPCAPHGSGTADTACA